MRWHLPLLLLTACDVPYDVPDEPPDAGRHFTVPEAWSRVRTEMVKARACFADRRPYCVIERDVLDEAIQEDLDTHFHGRMPLNERWVDEVTNRARASWNESMKTRYRSRVEQRVAENWDAPHRDKKRGRVDVDLFVPPGELSVEKGDWVILSDLVRDHELYGRELARQLDRYRGQYPNMPVVRLLIDIPIQDGLGFRRWDVRHHLESDRIIVSDPTDPAGAWVTEPLGPNGFVPYINGLKSLSTLKLPRCGLSKRIADAPDCSVHPPYNPTKQRKGPKKKDRVPRAGWDPVEEEEG